MGGITEMNRPMKTILPIIVLAFMAEMAQSEEPSYTLAQIDSRIRDGSATERLARFANQGLGCTSYLWKESADHRVFFFRQDGVNYGEFRDEVSGPQGLSVHEQYLTASARNPETLTKAETLRFVIKQSSFVRKNNVCLEANIRWSFLTTDRSGNVIQREKATEKRMIRGVVSIVVPPELRPAGETFFVNVKRSHLTPHEREFGYEIPVFEHFGLSGGRCSIWTEWPEDDPQLTVILSKKLPNPPANLDANPDEVRTKDVATMKISLNPPMNVPYVFIPEER